MIIKKTLFAALLGETSFAIHAQTVDQPQKPAKILVLKKVNAGDAAAKRSASDAVAPGVMNLPLAGNKPLQAAVRPAAQELPGLGTMPGEADEMRIKSVRVGTDRNERIYIAQGQLNKISTPFESPIAIDSTGATLKTVGQDIYIQPTSEAPLTVYVTNGGQGQSIGLALVPSPSLPAQTIVLMPDTPSGSAAVKAEAEEIVAGDYVSRITGLVKTLALGKTPAGFTRSRLPASVITGKELVIEPQQKYSGSTYDLYAYKVRSISISPLEMREEAFYSDAVRAVAFYPSALLQTGEETMVFVIADRPSKESAQ